MRHALYAALLAAVATPAFAASTEHSFDAGGQHYTYVAERTGQGDVLLHGLADGSQFDLRVHGNNVNGTVGLSEVSFQIPASTVARLADEVQSDGAAAPTTLAAN